jgi:hypothetical protein
VTRRPVILAGQPLYGAWCPACKTDTRIRIPLHLDSIATLPVTELSICTACGQGRMPSRPEVTLDPAKRSWPWWHPWLRMLWWWQRRQCRKAGRTPTACAFGDCRKPGWWDCAWIEQVELGRVRHVFCGGGHRAQWLGQRFGITKAR